MDEAAGFCLRKQDVISCMFSSWYRKLKHLTMESVIIPLPPEFIHYLNSDGIVLPSGHFETKGKREETEDDSWDSSSDGETTHNTVWEQPQFAALHKKIQQTIDYLGGIVFPKLNWSSPLDAKWISSNGTLQCCRPSDIYLLLKSSNRVAHDLSKAFRSCTDYDQCDEPPGGFQLVLRQWVDIIPGMEFRCFVKDSMLIAVCQRDYTTFYNHLVLHQDELMIEIEEYYRRHILSKFSLRHYVFDIYRNYRNSYMLIDFNPFSSITEPLLFTWEELTDILTPESTDPQHPMFRFLTSDAGIQPNKDAYSRLPIDVVDLSTGEDIAKFIDLFKKETWQQDDNSDDEASEQAATLQ
ncbi:cell division cycle protein 123 homolog [Corticium candelabrum]|uniref:cell division cycle protein 123 homolog n=1 Tax=Corticium candelabrum TaxID=121492 RepID=UPI002E26D4EC|nr:cell division cycle protein 123 homolog [Corticium candelabrum]